MVGHFQLCCFSAIIYSLGLNVSDQVRAGIAPARGKGTAQYRLCEGGGTASSVCTRMIDTSQTLPLALIGCVDLGVVDPRTVEKDTGQLCKKSTVRS